MNDMRKFMNILKEGEIVQGPWKQKIANDHMENAVKVPLRNLFGGSEYNIIRDMGFHFMEKPSYFSDLYSRSAEKYTISKGNIAAIERNIGRKLYKYSLEDILEGSSSRKGIVYNILADTVFDAPYSPSSDEETFIVIADDDDNASEFSYKAGDMFLCNKTGATSYIRMWMRIV
jgi:hypothetical protein